MRGVGVRGVRGVRLRGVRGVRGERCQPMRARILYANESGDSISAPMTRCQRVAWCWLSGDRGMLATAGRGDASSRGTLGTSPLPISVGLYGRLTQAL